jgi:hypothetical protein
MGLRYQYFHISTLPRLNYVVWCRVPEADGSPGKTVRPALVRGSKRDPTTGRGALWVSYGTTKLNLTARDRCDLIIQNSARLDQLNLPSAVRFNLDFANWLPWAAEFFAPPEHSLYIVAGPLNDLERGRLRRCLQRRGIIQAL